MRIPEVPGPGDRCRKMCRSIRVRADIHIVDRSDWLTGRKGRQHRESCSATGSSRVRALREQRHLGDFPYSGCSPPRTKSTTVCYPRERYSWRFVCRGVKTFSSCIVNVLELWILLSAKSLFSQQPNGLGCSRGELHKFAQKAKLYLNACKI